ncbi:MAG TPA: right-handed parallel beta-helix repeat-containing protein [Dehalococcoidia bacterium]|nr:right-handed parallel beta-helix repeat-containing protein [Dehalococcoidia bacterium]
MAGNRNAPRPAARPIALLLAAFTALLAFWAAGYAPVPSASAQDETRDGASPASQRPIIVRPDSPLGLQSGLTPSPSATAEAEAQPTQVGGALVVGSGGFATVRQAVAAASPGQTIRIRAGTYRESVVIDKPLTLEAYGDGPVWLDGGCSAQAIVTVRSSDVTLRGLGLKRSAGAGVSIESGAARVTVENSTIQDFNCGNAQEANRAGIAAWYPGRGIRLVGNTVRYRAELPGGPRGGGNGIWFKSDSSRPSGGGHYIARNTVIGGWDGLGGEPEGDPRGSFDRDTIIENNVVRDCGDDGIQVEGGGQNVRVMGNDIAGCGTGIAFAAPMSGPLYVERNYIHDLVAGPQGNLFCYKVGNRTSATVYLTENRCLVGPGADGLKQTNSGLGPVVSRRNVYHTSRYVFELGDRPPAGSSFDYDCLYTSDSSRFIKWGGTRYSDLRSFQRGTGQEPNGRQTADCSWLSGGISSPAAAQPPAPSMVSLWSCGQEVACISFQLPEGASHVRLESALDSSMSLGRQELEVPASDLLFGNTIAVGMPTGDLWTFHYRLSACNDGGCSPPVWAGSLAARRWPDGSRQHWAFVMGAYQALGSVYVWAQNQVEVPGKTSDFVFYEGVQGFGGRERGRCSQVPPGTACARWWAGDSAYVSASQAFPPYGEVGVGLALR